MKLAPGKYLLLALVATLTTGALDPNIHKDNLEIEEFQDADDWFRSGLALNAAGRYNDAAQAFGRVVSIEPANAFAWMNLGTMQALVGDFEESVASLKRSVLLAPKLAQGYSNLGEVCFKTGRFREAVQAYSELLLIWPDNANAHYKRGLAFLFIDEPASAETEHQALKQLDPELASQLLRAMELASRQD